MDVHIVPGVKATDVAQAHRMDVLIQNEHQCKCMTYWIDEERETIFCLIEAPTKEAVSEMHGRAHGLIPNKIIEVNSNLVGSFLGRIYDPIDADMTDGLKIFKDPSFRTLLLIKTPDRALVKYRFGTEKAEELLESSYAITRRNVAKNEGREVEAKNRCFIASFVSAASAVACAVEIQKELPEEVAELDGVKIAINAGEPVANSNDLFGDTIQLAHYMCNVSKNFHIALSSSVNELISSVSVRDRENKIIALSPREEEVLCCLFRILEENWQDADFNVSQCCSSMAMSKSHLYRKTMAVCGLSPVSLLKNFRLEKALELMRKQRYNISEITFASGFNSPSYFTKCFKKRYGLLPMTYVDLLH